MEAKVPKEGEGGGEIVQSGIEPATVCLVDGALTEWASSLGDL